MSGQLHALIVLCVSGRLIGSDGHGQGMCPRTMLKFCRNSSTGRRRMRAPTVVTHRTRLPQRRNRQLSGAWHRPGSMLPPDRIPSRLGRSYQEWNQTHLTSPLGMSRGSEGLPPKHRSPFGPIAWLPSSLLRDAQPARPVYPHTPPRPEMPP
jgi:hypothetical protein